MKTIIVYVDDADYARSLLLSALQGPEARSVHWVLVGCAPRITHRVSKFVSNRARESWRTKWAERLFEDCTSLFAAQGVKVSTVLARVPLPQLLDNLAAEHGAAAQVLDMRRPKIQDAPVSSPSRGLTHKLLGAVTGVGTLWAVLLGETLAA